MSNNNRGPVLEDMQKIVRFRLCQIKGSLSERLGDWKDLLCEWTAKTVAGRVIGPLDSRQEMSKIRPVNPSSLLWDRH